MVKKQIILSVLCLFLIGAFAMTFFGRLFGKKSSSEVAGARMAVAWESHPSIYEHLKAHIRTGQKGLTEGGESLPDDETFWRGSKYRWIAGGLDGTFSRHGSPGEAEALAASALDLIRAYCRSPSREHKLKVHEWTKQHRTLDSVDSLLEGLRKEKGIDMTRLHDLARSFAIESPDREPVKFGVAVLGLFQGQHDREIFQLLGRHEEFTLYCAVALANTSEKPEDDLWRLAQNVHGWGRIHVVDRLAKTQNPRIKDWLLREGYKNSVMNEYLAYTCAKNGDLKSALERDTIDEGLMNSAGEIIVALIAGGPAENMDEYGDGEAVVEAYLRHMAPRASTTKHFVIAHTIKSWLSEEDADWKARESRGWTGDKRALLMDKCEEILSRPPWRKQVLTELKSEDEQVFLDADRAADVLKIDTWEYHWDRLRRSPLTPARWFNVMKVCNDERVSEVIALAEKSLPLEDIGTGPANEMGISKQYEPHSCLNFVLQHLGRFPGHGVALVKAGLRSPVVSNRNMALRALSGWGASKWPEGMDQLLRDALAREPEGQVKEWIQKVLDGKPLD